MVKILKNYIIKIINKIRDKVAKIVKIILLYYYIIKNINNDRDKVSQLQATQFQELNELKYATLF